MQRSQTQFAEELTRALYRAKANTGKRIGTLEDELGYAVGRNGGEFIRYLRKGHIPADPADVDQLAAALLHYTALDQKSALVFLLAAGYPRSGEWLAAHFNGTPPLLQSSQANNLGLTNDTTSLANPFVVGPPVTNPRQFFGRRRELQQIFHGWQGETLEHLAIIGPRRSGKTSLLHYIRQLVAADEEHLSSHRRWPGGRSLAGWQWIMIDFQDPRMANQERLLYHLLQGLGLPVAEPCSLARFVEIVTEQGVRANSVIVMDELDAALRMAEFDRSFWLALRYLLNTPDSGQIAFLVSASVSPMQLAMDVQKSSPLFNMFKTLALGAFSETDALALLATTPIPFSQADCEWMLRESGLWPALIQLLAQTRLFALQQGERDEQWKHEAQRRLEPYRYLLESRQP